MGYLLIMMAQDGGFPVPVGGAGQLTAALARRAEAAGARVECGRPVESIVVSGDRATAVRTADGATITCRRAIIADTSAPQLYQRLLPKDALPSALRRGLDRFVWDTPVLKINYALDKPIPWRSSNLGDAGTVHLGANHDGLIRWMADLNTRTLPENPFLLFGQMTTSDPTRSPTGTESAWAYTHLPRGLADDQSAERLAERVDKVLEAHAPGFTGHVVGKSIQRPSDLETSDANLHTGAVNGGTSQLFQQLIFRPAPGFGRAETPLQNVFLGSAGASPGGGVHGVCGRNAARAALAADGVTGWPRRRVNRAVSRLFTR
jgi:phytoene dehydrogenase-like protein